MTPAPPSPFIHIRRYVRTRLPLIMSVVWLLAMFILYYLRHNPIESYQGLSLSAFGARVAGGLAQPKWSLSVLAALGRDLRDVAAVASLIVLGGGIGTLIVPHSGVFTDSERPVIQALTGIGLISTAILIIGLAGLFPPGWLGWVITLILMAALNRPAWAWVRAVIASARQVFDPGDSRYARVLRWIILVMLVAPLLVALLPPTKWDALTYHLAGPKLYLSAGKIVPAPDNHFLGFPQLVEMLYLWLMILGRPAAAGLLHLCFSYMAVWLTMTLPRRLGRPAAGFLAAIVLLACDSLWNEFAWPYNDLALMAFIIAAVITLIAWGRAEDSNWRLLILAGVFVGFGMGTKYTALGPALGVAALAAWIARKQGVIAVLKVCGMVSVAALVVFAPWLAKNLIVDGNPVSPFAFGSSGFDRYDQFYYLRPGTGLALPSVILAPIQGTVFGKEGLAPYGGSAGVLTVTLFPLVFVAWSRLSGQERVVIKELLIFLLPPYLLWLVGIATSWYLVQTRLLYPLFPVLAVIGALGVERLAGGEVLVPNPGLIARGMALIAAIVTFGITVPPLLLRGDWLVALGLQSEESYLASNLGDHYLAVEKVDTLPAGAKVILLWEPRVYYCEPRCIPDSLIDQWWHDRQTLGDPARIVEHWKSQGATHVLIFESGLHFLTTEEPYEPLTQADISALDQVRRTDLSLVWDGRPGYTLYRIQGTPP